MSHIRIHINESLNLSDRNVETTHDMVSAYQDNIKKHGYSAETLFYSDEELHAAKIIQYATLAHRIWSGCPSVLDIGCGYGSIIPFLPQCSYAGIDVVPEFVEEARRRYPGRRLEVKDIYEYNEKSEWVLLLGIMGSVPEPERLVTRAWELTTVGLIVDFIDSEKYKGHLNRNSYNIGACLSFLMGLGSSHIEIFSPSGFNWVIMLAYKQGVWSAL